MEIIKNITEEEASGPSLASPQCYFGNMPDSYIGCFNVVSMVSRSDTGAPTWAVAEAWHLGAPVEDDHG